MEDKKPRRTRSKKDVKPTEHTFEEPSIIVDGLGTRIANLTKAVGIEPCESCKKRKTWLDNLFTFSKVRALSDEEFQFFGDFIENRASNRLTAEEANTIEKMYMDIFKVRTKLCRTCPSVWKSIIEKLNRIYIVQKDNQ